MTATQAPPTSSAPDAPSGDPRPPVTGFAGVLGSADHKVVGRLYLGVALLFGLASGVTGVLAAVDRIDGSLLDADVAGQVVTFHATSAVLLFLGPALLGLALVVVPLQVGARAVAFPRAAAASFWTYLVGGSLFATAYAINGGPGGGRSDAIDLWAVATVVLCGALVLGSICVATTALAARTRGMSLDRAPLFTWAMLSTCVVWILTLPVLVAAMLITYVDHRYGQVLAGSAGPEMFERIAWLGRQPQVYVFAVPLLGLALDAVATATGRPLPNRGAAQVLVGAFAVLGIGAFALAAFAPEAADQPVTKGMALLAPLPVLGLLGLAASALRAGATQVTSGLVAGLAGLLVLLLGTLVGAATPFEGALELAGTQWISAQSHLTLVAATIGLLGGLAHWSTKVVGRAAGEPLARTAPLLLLVGALVLAVPEAVSGLVGDGEEAVTGIEGLDVVSVVGAGIVLLGAAVGVLALVGRPRDDEPADPWGGQTLEWATASPPSFANFDGEVPAVTSPEPLLADAADAEEDSP